MAKEKKKKVKVVALCSLAGHYLLPHDAGTEFEIDELQAAHMVEMGHCEYAGKGKDVADEAADSPEE